MNRLKQASFDVYEAMRYQSAAVAAQSSDYKKNAQAMSIFGEEAKKSDKGLRGLVDTGTIMGIDARYAIQRVTSTNASYQAQEDFVLRRGSAMRWDFGQICRRLFNDAFEVLTYTP